MRIEDAINLLDEMFDASWSLPLSGGKCVIDIERGRDIVDNMRENMPVEIQQAENLILHREEMLAKAREEAEQIIRKAEERAQVLLNQDKAVKSAQQKGSEILAQAQQQSRELRLATHQFSDNVLKQTEESLYRSLEELKNTRQALRGNVKQLDQG